MVTFAPWRWLACWNMTKVGCVRHFPALTHSYRFRDRKGMPGYQAASDCRQHFLNFLPLPQGQGSLRPSFR
jgi:hypothetical protein